MSESFLQKFVGKPISKINPSYLEFSWKSKCETFMNIFMKYGI